MEWHHYLRQGEVEVHPSYHRSYLNMKKRIQEEVQKGLAHFERHQAFRKVHLDEPQGIYVRIVNNEATISLDTSGNLLHRRGYKTNTVEAPVRETLGAALYWMCYQELGGVPEIILDPMAGSGTLVMEPMIFWSSWRRRNFAYQNFPCASKRLSVETTQALPPIETMPRLLAGDTSEKATSALKENFSALAKKEKWNIDIRQGDWLDVWAENELAGQGLMLLNPPYNLRLEADQEALAQQLQSFVKKVRPSLVGVIWPGRKLPVIEGKWVQHVTTTNGGVPVSLGVLRP